MTASINTYCQHQGLDPQYHTFADVLQSNHVSPHQVILASDINGFCHLDAGHTLRCATAKYPKEPSLRTLRDFFLLLCLVVGSVQEFSFGGLFIWRAVVFAFVFLCVCVWRARSTSFRYQMVLPFV